MEAKIAHTIALRVWCAAWRGFIEEAVGCPPYESTARAVEADCRQYRKFIGAYSNGNPGRTFSSMRATANASGPSIEQPLAHWCPPPPKPSAISATLSFPLLRRLTR